MARKRTTTRGPFLLYLELLRDRIADPSRYPFALPALRCLETLGFHPKVTFLVGENGSGKSTLLEAIAVAWGLNPEGGSLNFNFATRASHSPLGDCIRLARPPSSPGTATSSGPRASSTWPRRSSASTREVEARRSSEPTAAGHSTSSRTGSPSLPCSRTGSATTVCTSWTSRRRRFPRRGKSNSSACCTTIVGRLPVRDRYALADHTGLSRGDHLSPERSRSPRDRLHGDRALPRHKGIPREPRPDAVGLV